MAKVCGLFLLVLCSGVLAAQSSIAPAPSITLATGAAPPAAAQINPGTTDNPGVQFALQTASTATFTELYIKNAGSAGAGDFTQLVLWRDNNSNGVKDNGDIQVTTFASGAFPVYSDFSKNPQSLGISTTATSDTFLVTIDVSNGATTGATFDLTITAAGCICSAGVTGSDVVGATQTVANGGTPAAVDITTLSLNNGAEGSAYAENISATGGTGPYGWSGTNIPGFLSLDTTQTGLNTTLTGNPTTGDAGTYNFSVMITESGGGSDTQAYSIDIVAVGGGVVIITTSISNGTVGLGYSATINAGGGGAPYTWSLASGALPPGLTLDTTSTTASTTLTGTPTTTGSYNFTVQVADASTNDTQLYTVDITNPGGGVGGLSGGGGGGGGGGCVALDGNSLWLPLAALLLFAVLGVARRTKA